MELEFSRDGMIGRLKKMQNIFGSGKVINPSKIQNTIMGGETLTLAKQFHKQQQELNRSNLNQLDAMLKKVSSEKESFHRKVDTKMIMVVPGKPV